eukprot:EG_transcript_25050
MGALGQTLFKALKRKQRQLSSNLDHLLLPRYVPTLCHQMTPAFQDAVIRMSLKIVPAETPAARRELFNAALRDAFQSDLQPGVAFEALRMMGWLQTRLQTRRGDGPDVALDDVQYKFQVGDIVAHRMHGQVGVVAECFAMNMMPDAWIDQNLGSFDAKTRASLLQNPWYTILIDSRTMPQSPDFVRYGSEITHTLYRGPPLDAIHHRLLPHLFSRFDTDTLRYVPRYEPNSKELLRWLLRRDVQLTQERLLALMGPPP